MSEIAVIGAGAWGTALSIALGRKDGHRVRLWAYEKEVCQSIGERRVNELFLPGCQIPPAVTPTNSMEEALRGAEIVVSVMPSHHCRGLFRQIAPHVTPPLRLCPQRDPLPRIALSNPEPPLIRTRLFQLPRTRRPELFSPTQA